MEEKSAEELEVETVHVKASYDKEENKAVASTSVVDRQGEIIDQSGWDLKNFKKNPLLLWAHDHTIPAVGTAKNIKVEGTGKKAQLTFTPEFHDLTPEASAIKALFDGGILNSFSVGFQPIESEGNTYTKSELLEISAVNVPANPEARTMALKTMAAVVDEKVAKGILESMSTEKATDPMQSAMNKVHYIVGAQQQAMTHTQDLIAILGTALGFPSGDTDNDSQLTSTGPDKDFADLKKQMADLEEQLENVVKGLKYLNPRGRSEQDTAKLRHEAKTIVKASDKTLARDRENVQARVAKRAAEKLISSLK